MMPIPTARRLRRLAILPALAVGTLGLVASLHTGAATAASVTTVTGAGTGATDPSWTVTTPSVAATPATIVTTAPGSWTATITGAKWISTAAVPAAAPAGSYTFDAQVVVPAGSSVSGSVASADPVALSLVQGVTTTAIPGAFGASASTPTPVTFAGPVAAGTYTMRMVLNHTDAATPVGVIATFTLSDGATEPPATQYHALAVPVRVYDSRTGTGSAATGEGAIASGTTRTISLTQGYASASATTKVPAVPAGATSAMVNITIDGTTTTGFLTAYGSDVAQPATSGINWFGPGQILANLSVVAVGPTGSIKITAGGGGTTQLVVDVVGYFR